MNNRHFLWLLPVIAYLAFAFWYTNTEGPLSAGEIESFSQKLAEAGFKTEEIAYIHPFMESDTGRQFFMVNNIDLNENPPAVEGAPGETATQLMGRYMDFMFPELLRRACHPVFVGNVVHSSMDLAGIEGAEQWDQFGLMRYRSRRDLLEIATNPEFVSRHKFKTAALTKTIAYPTETMLYLSDLRFFLALILFSLTALLDLAIFGRSRK